MKTRVLVVEDDPTWLAQFQKITESEIADIFEFQYASTLADTLVKVEESDIVILDLILPNGPSNTLQVVGAAAGNKPIIVSSSVHDEAFIQQAFTRVYDYVEKGKWDMPVLIHCLQQSMRRYIAEQYQAISSAVDSVLEKFKQTDARLSEFQKKLEATQAK